MPTILAPKPIRLIFDQPQKLKRIALVFEETETERTQEFVLRWSPDGGRSFREIVRQQWKEEGLLHIVFALDLLLGGSSWAALTAVLAERTAIVSHLAVGRPIEEAIGFVGECYDMRSAYVHRGEKGSLVGLNQRFEKLFGIARAVLGAACFARLQPWCQNKDARDAWIKRIDVLRARYTAGLPFAPTELDELGLGQIRLRTGELVSVLIEKA